MRNRHAREEKWKYVEGIRIFYHQSPSNKHIREKMKKSDNPAIPLLSLLNITK